jgi:hypothetical protein
MQAPQKNSGTLPIAMLQIHTQKMAINQKLRRQVPKFTKDLSSHKLIKPLANYIEATGRFKIEPSDNMVHGA